MFVRRREREGGGERETYFSATVFAQETISIAVVQRDFGAFDKKTTVEGERECVDLDVTSLDV